ncbi:MAG: hypothetical protein H6832_14425 [Planctomycetes bacterium]|nr:hypothetical protein [Planctomycetota bacterium]
MTTFDDRDDTDFLDRMRSLDEAAPSPRREFGVMLRARVLKRARLEEISARTLAPRTLREWSDSIRVRILTSLRYSRLARWLVAAFVLVVLGLVTFQIAATLQQRIRDKSARLDLEGRVAAAVPSPVENDAAPLWEPQAIDARLLWLESENDLTRLRRLWDERGKVELRRRLLKIGGADERTRRRIEALASDVAADVLVRASRNEPFVDYADVEAFALGVRALLGSGSTRLRGPQQAAVRRGITFLERSLPGLRGAELATALVPCLEAALVAGDERVLSDEGRLERVGREIARLVDEELEAFDAVAPKPVYPERAVPLDLVFRDRMPRPFALAEPRVVSVGPWLGRIDAPNGAVADAGMLLRVAPALGAEPGDVQRLRGLLHDVLRERSMVEGSAGAAARAAMLVAFASGNQRLALRRSLQAYRIHPDRFGRDVRALLDLAWGVFPGVGWARFNQALRYVIANYDEETARERAGLLLVQLLWTEPVPSD